MYNFPISNPSPAYYYGAPRPGALAPQPTTYPMTVPSVPNNNNNNNNGLLPPKIIHVRLPSVPNGGNGTIPRPIVNQNKTDVTLPATFPELESLSYEQLRKVRDDEGERQVGAFRIMINGNWKAIERT